MTVGWKTKKGGTQDTKFVSVGLAALIVIRSDEASKTGSAAERFATSVMDYVCDASMRARSRIDDERRLQAKLESYASGEGRLAGGGGARSI